MSKRLEFTISGVDNNAYHDGQMKCKYIYVSSNAGQPTSKGEMEYSEALTTYRTDYPMVLDFTTDYTYKVNDLDGLAALTEGDNYFSIYRREYQVFERIKERQGNTIVMEEQVYKGPWEPVVVNTTQSSLRDFNITSGRSYQYVLYPESVDNRQQFANLTEEGDYASTGKPVETQWNAWSIAELIPEENNTDAPIVKKTYRVDLDNIWMFKYGLETGSQNQNFSKADIQNLGQYLQLGYGKQNYVSGDVSAYLGSEIVPYKGEGYIERTLASIRKPLSTNEKVAMLNQWRAFAYSPNPKLLKDIKGQSWIVQIVSSSNTPKNFYKNQPDTISFSWKQIESTDNVVIYGAGSILPKRNQCDSVWEKKDAGGKPTAKNILQLNKTEGIAGFYYKINGAPDYEYTSYSTTLYVDHGSTFYAFAQVEKGYALVDSLYTAQNPYTGIMGANGVTWAPLASPIPYSIQLHFNNESGINSTEVMCMKSPLSRTIRQANNIKLPYALQNGSSIYYDDVVRVTISLAEGATVSCSIPENNIHFVYTGNEYIFTRATTFVEGEIYYVIMPEANYGYAIPETQPTSETFNDEAYFTMSLGRRFEFMVNGNTDIYFDTVS